MIIADKINLRYKRTGLAIFSFRDHHPNKFGNSELKLFTWAVVLYCHANDLVLQELVLSISIRKNRIISKYNRYSDSSRSLELSMKYAVSASLRAISKQPGLRKKLTCLNILLGTFAAIKLKKCLLVEEYCIRDVQTI
jgi:hypothetical protein